MSIDEGRGAEKKGWDRGCTWVQSISKCTLERNAHAEYVLITDLCRLGRLYQYMYASGPGPGLRWGPPRHIVSAACLNEVVGVSEARSICALHYKGLFIFCYINKIYTAHRL